MSKLSKRLPEDYAVLLSEVKERVRSAQYEALKAVNKQLVSLYWDIGKLIAERQTKADYGAAIAEQLAADLQQEFFGVSGYSRRNVFYIRMTRKFGWSKNVLIHQIENQSYEKTLLGQTNFDKALTPGQRAQAKLAVKDEYTFDFLEMGKEHSERELERALIVRIEDFLRAMGGLLAFVGSQFRLAVDDSAALSPPSQMPRCRRTQNWRVST